MKPTKVVQLQYNELNVGEAKYFRTDDEVEACCKEIAAAFKTKLNRWQWRSMMTDGGNVARVGTHKRYPQIQIVVGERI